MQKEGVALVLTAQTIDAAKHVAQAKLIFTATIPKIVINAQADIGALPGKETATIL